MPTKYCGTNSLALDYSCMKEWSMAEPSPFMFYKYFRQHVLVRYYVKATKNIIERDMPNLTAEQKSSSEDLRSFFEWDLDFNFGLKLLQAGEMCKMA